MASLTGTPTITSNGHAHPATNAGSSARAPKLAVRNRARVAGGAALVGLSALVGVALLGESRHEVLAVARQVEAGQVVVAQDFKVVRIPAEPGLRTVSASELPRILGRASGVALVPGGLLSPAQLTDKPTLPPGTMIVGAVLKPGQFPLGLRAGDSVRLVVLAIGGATTDPNGETATEAPVPVEASVTAVERVPDSAGATAVSLALVPEMAPAIAAAGAEGRLSVMRALP